MTRNIGEDKGYALTDLEVREEARKMAAAMRVRIRPRQTVVPQIKTPQGVTHTVKGKTGDLL